MKREADLKSFLQKMMELYGSLLFFGEECVPVWRTYV